jgi:hypothetical protein
MSLGSMRPPEGALGRPLVWSRESSRPSEPSFGSRWHDTMLQGPVSTTALALATSRSWHMTLFFADSAAQLRGPCSAL